MLYRRCTPPPPLAAFVDCLWYSEGLQGTHARERLLPNGESGIVFDLRERPSRIFNPDDPCEWETYSPAVFCGARTDYFLLDTSQQERVIGIQFRPGGAFPFLGMPASEVAHRTYSLDDIWSTHAALIREELLNSQSVPAMFSVLERALLSRLKRAPFLHPAVAFAAAKLSKPAGNTRVQDVVDRIGMSSRHLKELFRAQTGLAPKAFQRVRRFQHVLQALRRDFEEPGATLAAECGYYDQAHFIHDFKHFSGTTPSEYVTVATPHLNHIPLL
jgi:AraC-like DNA-binding protein